jgi:hypothetical protein
MRTNRTRSQERILNLLKVLNRSLSAQDIYLELRNSEQSMGLATVYRSLDGLKREGFVHVRTLASGESLYGAAHQDQHHHDRRVPSSSLRKPITTISFFQNLLSHIGIFWIVRSVYFGSRILGKEEGRRKKEEVTYSAIEIAAIQTKPASAG